MKKILPLIILSLFICSCSTYNLYVLQVTPQDLEKLKMPESKEAAQQETNPAIGDMSKAPNRNFTDVRNYGNLLYIAVDTQTPKVISTNAALTAQGLPMP